MLQQLKRLLHHRWLDEGDTRRAIPTDLVERLMRRVTASEQRHSGEVRICVEASLPSSYIWRNASVPRTRGDDVQQAAGVGHRA